MAIRSVVQSIVRPVGIKVVHSFISGKEAASPLNLVNSGPCQFWFDGQDSATLSLNGNKVIQWDDKSGFNRHVSNAVDAQRATWDSATGRVTFVIANFTYLQCTAADFGAPLVQPNTIYVLYKINNYVNSSLVFESADAAARNVMLMVGDNFSCYAGVVLSNGAINLLNNIHCVEYNGANTNYWINGINVASGNAGAQNYDGITLGADITLLQQFSSVEIMEVFGYNCLLTEAERTALNAYLTSKWGL